MTARTFDSLRIERHEGFAEVVLTGPGKGNALGPELFRDLPAAIAELDVDASIRAIVLRGDGAHFTYGLDLMAMAGELGPLIAGNNLARERTDLLALIRRLQDAVSSLANARAPVINAIHGWCIGGGLDLATACDVRLCSAEAKFSVREVRVAIVADLGTLQRLPRIVGQGHARQLALTGEDFDAAKAREMTACKRGHPLSGENVYINDGHRVCKVAVTDAAICRAIRVAAATRDVAARGCAAPRRARARRQSPPPPPPPPREAPHLARGHALRGGG
jgi:enoyl-CoA hydratase/carnithine racemase